MITALEILMLARPRCEISTGTDGCRERIECINRLHTPRALRKRILQVIEWCCWRYRWHFLSAWSPSYTITDAFFQTSPKLKFACRMNAIHKKTWTKTDYPTDGKLALKLASAHQCTAGWHHSGRSILGTCTSMYDASGKASGFNPIRLWPL